MKKQVISNWDKLPVVLNLHMVALVFDVSDATVKNWIKQGTITGTRIGRKWLFDKDYIKSLTEQNTIQKGVKAL